MCLFSAFSPTITRDNYVADSWIDPFKGDACLFNNKHSDPIGFFEEVYLILDYCKSNNSGTPPCLLLVHFSD